MSAKWDVRDIIRANFRTYRNNTTDKVMVSDYIAFVITPMAIALTCSFMAHFKHFKLLDVSRLVGGIGIFTGLLFGLLTNVFTLSLRVQRDEGLTRDHELVVQVKELFANVSWSVIVGLTLVVAMVAASVTHKSTQPVGAAWTGVLTFLFLHLVMTVFMALKRLWFAHSKIARLPPKN